MMIWKRHNSFIKFFTFSTLILLAYSATSQAQEPPDELIRLDPYIRQAVIVEVNAEDNGAIVSLWERAQEEWQESIVDIKAVAGRNGAAGLGEKREGDGRTPSGSFELRRAFGYDATVKTGLGYAQVKSTDFWIDDPGSKSYNQWVEGIEPPTVSHERLKRDDDLYKYAIIVEYNTHPVVPGLGSAIFIHVWRGPDSPTAGCVAMAEEDILRLLHRLDREKNPVAVIKKRGSSTESVGKIFSAGINKAVDSMENPRKPGFSTEPTATATAKEFESGKIEYRNILNDIHFNALREILNASYPQILQRRQKR